MVLKSSKVFRNNNLEGSEKEEDLKNVKKELCESLAMQLPRILDMKMENVNFDDVRCEVEMLVLTPKSSKRHKSSNRGTGILRAGTTACRSENI